MDRVIRNDFLCAAWHQSCQITTAVTRCISAVVISLGDVIRGNPWLIQAEMEGVYKVLKEVKFVVGA